MAVTISRDEVRIGIDTGAFILVDALPPANYDQQHLPGAVNLVADQVADLAPSLLPDKDRPRRIRSA